MNIQFVIVARGEENMPTKSDALRRISVALDAISVLQASNVEAPEFVRWRRGAKVAISNAFGEVSDHLREFDGISFFPYSIIVGSDNSAEKVRSYQEGLTGARALLQSMLDEIEEYWPGDDSPQAVAESREMPQQLVSNRVFVVHGRDDGAKNTVARFLESFDLEAVILHEQPNEGRTIVEKFVDYADVGFAVVLCTPDDVGALATDRENLRDRPRQNVVMELGFFLAKLGRNKVCPLVKGDLEMPSDYDGVLYVQMEGSEDWRTKLAIELKGAGLPVDLNRLAGR